MRDPAETEDSRWPLGTPRACLLRRVLMPLSMVIVAIDAHSPTR